MSLISVGVSSPRRGCYVLHAARHVAGLAGNKIGDEGATALACSLPHMSRLTTLNLRGAGRTELLVWLTQIMAVEPLVVALQLPAVLVAIRDAFSERFRSQGGNGARRRPAAHGEHYGAAPRRYVRAARWRGAHFA